MPQVGKEIVRVGEASGGISPRGNVQGKYSTLVADCRRSNIFDNMLAIMEKYTNTLESLVDQRTTQLAEEKKKTEALLLRMLPR